MSSDNSQLAKKVAVVAAVSASAIGLAYLISKQLKGKSKVNTKSLSVEELKQLGNKYFSAKQYKDAVDAFTAAVNSSEEGSENIKAMCYQNRAAAKERVGTYSPSNMILDCEEALKLNPLYGKAYWRKARLENALGDFKNALISTFCASHLDASFSKDAAAILYTILEQLEKIYREEWEKNLEPGGVKVVRHERVYTWLYKTVMDDCLRSVILSWDRETNTQFGKALSLIADQKYDSVAFEAEKEEGDNKLEALVLAARFYSYQNKISDSERCLNLFNDEWGKLSEDMKISKNAALISQLILKIEMSRTKEEIIKSFYNALSFNTRNPDFYAMAAFRLVLAEEKEEAIRILSTEGLENHDNLNLLRYTLAIMNGTDGSDPASLFKSIKSLEEFVNGLEKKTPYSRTLLAKVYATFGQEDIARELMDELVKQYPRVSVFLFDRGCMGKDRIEALEFMERCIEVEPNHAEANLMYASLKLDQSDAKLISPTLLDEFSNILDRAEAAFDSNIDFPVLSGVFRMRAIVDAKRKAAKILNVF